MGVAEARSISEKHRVVMFHIGRSGSTVLADQLGQHPDILWDGEIFEVNNHLWDGKEVPAALLRRRLDAAADSIYGFEFKFFHASLIGMTLGNAVRHLVTEGFDRFVVLKRRNYLKKIVSSRLAAVTMRWFVPPGTQAPLTRIPLDLDCLAMDDQERPLLEFLQEYDILFQLIGRMLVNFPVLWLSYEDDIEPDPAVGYRKLCDFLDLPDAPAAVRFGRTTPYELHQVIENFDQVRETLSDTPYAWMLAE